MLCTAAEFQQFLPILLEEVQNPGDTGILEALCAAKGIPVDVDMEAAGAGLMAGVTHGDSLLHELRPRHSFLMELQRHGVGDNLKAIV